MIEACCRALTRYAIEGANTRWVRIVVYIGAGLAAFNIPFELYDHEWRRVVANVSVLLLAQYILALHRCTRWPSRQWRCEHDHRN